MKSTTCFPTSLRGSLYVVLKPPKGGSKTQKGRFRCKIALRLKKLCYKVSLFEKCQRKSCTAFIGLKNRAKIIGEGGPLHLSRWSKIADFFYRAAWNADAVLR